MNIGRKIKTLRKAKRLTLAELSKRSGVQMATLSRIENEKMTGTLDSHLKISKALGVSLTQLYTNIIREDSMAEFHSSPAAQQVCVHNEKASYEILTSQILSKKMMPTLIKIEPGGETAPELHPGGAEKFIYVLEGSIEAHINDQKFTLEAHNTLYFDAAERHHFTNTSTATVRLICVLTPISI